MQTFQKILFPIDMSDSCTAAAPFVATMAKKFQAEVTLLHVLQMPPGYVTDWYGYMALVDTGQSGRRASNEFDQYLKQRICRDHCCGARCWKGDAAQMISDYAAEHGTDLIMMPTHGYGIFRSMLLGSVTAKVLHDAACPVWTGVHVEETPPNSAAFERIMCAVDLTDKSILAMQFASKLAHDFMPSCGWCTPSRVRRRGRRNILRRTCRRFSRRRLARPSAKCRKRRA